jgi:hypothetical protein
MNLDFECRLVRFRATCVFCVNIIRTLIFPSLVRPKKHVISCGFVMPWKTSEGTAKSARAILHISIVKEEKAPAGWGRPVSRFDGGSQKRGAGTPDVPLREGRSIQLC